MSAIVIVLLVLAALIVLSLVVTFVLAAVFNIIGLTPEEEADEYGEDEEDFESETEERQ